MAALAAFIWEVELAIELDRTSSKERNVAGSILYIRCYREMKGCNLKEMVEGDKMDIGIVVDNANYNNTS